MSGKINRRDFLKYGSSGVIALGATLNMKYFMPLNAMPQQDDTVSRFVRSTCSPNCTGACGMLAEVSNGRIISLKPAADYPDEEYNPRGCLKGISYLNLIYGKDRLKYPLIRTGKRGSGEFRKATWEEALDYTAKNLMDVEKKYGPKSVCLTVQVPGTGTVQRGTIISLAAQRGWSMHNGFDMNGDLPIFFPMTFGVQASELEAVDWGKAKYTMIFGSNVVRTRVPDAKHMLKARDNGKLVVIDPNKCGTAEKAHEWLRPTTDTDAALALAMAKVIIDKNLYNKKFLQDFTDMPTLIRSDNGKRLKGVDVMELANEATGIIRKLPTVDEKPYREVYCYYNGHRIAVLNPEKIEDTQAVLEGSWDCNLKDGTVIKVSTAFQLLKELLNQYTPELVEPITGIKADVIKRIAREAAKAESLHVVFGASNYQWYHGDLKGRAIALLPVLTGNLGREGAGLSILAGQYKFRYNAQDWWKPKDSPGINWIPFLVFLRGVENRKDTPAGKTLPKSGVKAMVIGWSNPFDQHNMANRLKEYASGNEIDFIVATDYQMTTTCQWADVILPACTWYEKYELVSTPVHPYLQLQQPVIKSLFDSRTEVWMFRELAKRIDPVFAEKFYYMNLDEHAAAKEICKLILRTGGKETEGTTFEMLEKGPVRLHSTQPQDKHIPFWDQINQRKPFPPRSYPYPHPAMAKLVKSGRIEFYKDEDLFLSAGEQLPVFKPTYEETEYTVDPSSRKKYKFRYLTRNSIYRIHSNWSNDPWMNELEDYKPKIYINPEDMAQKDINGGDIVEVFNNRGRIRGTALADDTLSKGTVVFEQGWWSRYTPEQTSYNSLNNYWIKPIHEGAYFIPGVWSPITVWNETLCDIRKV